MPRLEWSPVPLGALHASPGYHRLRPSCRELLVLLYSLAEHDGAIPFGADHIRRRLGLPAPVRSIQERLEAIADQGFLSHDPDADSWCIAPAWWVQLNARAADPEPAAPRSPAAERVAQWRKDKKSVTSGVTSARNVTPDVTQSVTKNAPATHVRAQTAAESDSDSERDSESAAAGGHVTPTPGPRPPAPIPAAAEGDSLSIENGATEAALVEALTLCGVNHNAAQRLAHAHPEETRRQLELTRDISEEWFERSRAAYLTKAIPGRYGPPNYRAAPTPPESVIDRLVREGKIAPGPRPPAPDPQESEPP